MRQMAYDESPPKFLTLIFPNGMLDIACHKWFGVQQKNSQTSLCTKINAFTAIFCTWKFGWILDFSSAHSFELGFRRRVGLNLIHVLFILIIAMLNFIAEPKYDHSDGRACHPSENHQTGG